MGATESPPGPDSLKHQRGPSCSVNTKLDPQRGGVSAEIESHRKGHRTQFYLLSRNLCHVLEKVEKEGQFSYLSVAGTKYLIYTI